MCGGDMSPYSISGAKPQPPNVFLDIIGAYMSAGLGKFAVIFSVKPKKWGYSTPAPKSGGYAYPPYLPVNYAYAESLWRLGNDDSYSHNFSSDGREFWDGPLAPSVSATVTNATFSTLNKPTRLFPAREHQRYLASTRLRVM